MTHMTTIAPKAGPAPIFLKFMDEICNGDQDLVYFLQRALGAMLSGAIEEHWLMFWIGGGRNGKSTTSAILQEFLAGWWPALRSPWAPSGMRPS